MKTIGVRRTKKPTGELRYKPAGLEHSGAHFLDETYCFPKGFSRLLGIVIL